MKLSHSGIKGHDRALDLGKLNLVVGPNGSGKSSLASSLRFLLLGYDPPLGKSNARTAALSANGQMDVSLALDDGRVIQRELRRKGGTVTLGAECSWLRQATPSEHADELLKLAGREEKEALENLFAKGLLDLTPSEKARTFEAILASGKKTPKELGLATAKLAVQRLTKLEKELTDQNYKTAVGLLSEHEQASLKMLAPMLEAKLGETGIPGALTWANEEKNRAKRDLDGKEKAKIELEARLGESTDVPQSEIDALEAEKEALQKEIGAAQERERATAKRAQDVRIAKQEMDFAQTRYESARDEASKTFVIEDPERLESEAQRKLDTINEFKLDLAPSPKYAEEKVADLKAEIELATNSPWGEVKEIGQWLKRQRDDAVSARGTRLIQMSATALKGIDPDTLADELAKAEAELAKVVAEAQTVSDRNFDIVQKKAKLKNEAEAMRQRASEARKAEREGERITRALESATQAYEAARKRHEGLAKEQPAQDAPPPGIGSEERLEQIRVRLDGLHRLAGARQQFAEIILSINDLAALNKVFTAVEWALQRVREGELNESGGPLLAHIGKFLAAAGRKERPYFHASKSDFDIGWKDEKGREVAVQVMSGAEYALFTAALHSAVIALRNPPLKVLIVEAGEATQGTCLALMDGISAVAGSLDLALVLTPHSPVAVNPDWTVTRLG